MTISTFLYNSDIDITLRKHFTIAYFATYTLVFLAAYSMQAQTPVRIPFFGAPELQRVTGASFWSFMLCYPVFHLFSRAGLFRRYERTLVKFLGIALGAFALLCLLYFLQMEVSGVPSRRRLRFLLTPLGASMVQFGVAVAFSLGVFLILEPIRTKLRVGR